MTAVQAECEKDGESMEGKRREKLKGAMKRGRRGIIGNWKIKW